MFNKVSQSAQEIELFHVNRRVLALKTSEE